MSDVIEAASTSSWLAFRGFEASVIVNGDPVERFGMEYKYSTDEASTWIPSEAGKTFAIDYRRTGKEVCDYTMSLFLDGKKVACTAVKGVSGAKTYRIHSIPVSAIEVRNFLFNPAALTEDDEYLDNPISSGIGEIKVTFQAVNVTNETKPPKQCYSQPSQAEKIHERSKTGLIHQVGYDNKTKIIPGTRKWLLYDPVGDPVHLIFRYRSLEVLRANGIAPCPVARAISALPEEDSKQLQQEGERRSITTEGKEQDEFEPYNRGDVFQAQDDPVVATYKSIIEPETSQDTSSTTFERSAHDEYESDEDAEQIIITSLRTLLSTLENLSSKKRARKEVARTNSSKKPKIGHSQGSIIQSDHSSSTTGISSVQAKREDVAHTLRDVKKEGIPPNIEVIDLT